MSLLQPKRIFITGASRGIGRAVALKYAKEGAVLALAARNIVALEELVRYINEIGGEAYCIKCDVTLREEMKNAVEFAKEKMGGIDLGILNSGVSNHDWFEDYNSDNLRNTIETNLFGIAYGLEYIIPVMKEQGFGIIAGVSSFADFRGMPGSSSYAASKIAVSYLLQAARIELKNIGLKVITIRFGFIRTDMTKKNNFYMPFMLEPDDAANRIYNGIEKEKKYINFPLPMFLLTNLARIIPQPMYEFALGFRKRK